MKVASCSETSVKFYQAAHRHNPRYNTEWTRTSATNSEERRSRRVDNFLSSNPCSPTRRYEISGIEEKTSLRRYLQLWNELFIYFFKYLCGQFTEGVQSVYPVPDYIHYTVIAVIVGLCRTFEVCFEFAQKQRVFAQSVPLCCQLGWRTRHW
jgi:hypothetical protein